MKHYKTVQVMTPLMFNIIFSLIHVQCDSKIYLSTTNTHRTWKFRSIKHPVLKGAKFTFLLNKLLTSTQS